MVNFENGNIIDEDGFTTTFPSDFSIADSFGVNAIKDTFNRAFGEWKGHYKYLTHPVITLNHKICYWYGKNEACGKLYNEPWETADAYACDNLTGDELSYFCRTTD